MNKYVQQVIEDVKKKHSDQPEFVQTVKSKKSSYYPIKHYACQAKTFHILIINNSVQYFI